MANFRALSFLVLFWAGCALADEYSTVTQLMRAGKLIEAQNVADQYLANKPRDPQMRFLKGVIQRDSGKTTEAIATFTKLTEDYPELPEPYNNLAVLYASQNQYDKARASLEMAIRTNPSYATAHENLGDVYAKLAGQAYNKALQLDSTNTAVTPKLALIRELFSPTGRPREPEPATVPPSAAGVSTAPLSAAAPVAPPPASGVNASSAVAVPRAVAANKEPVPRTAKTPEREPADASASEVESAVRAWASAWSDKNVPAYLAAYGRDFVPPNGMTRAEWEAKRESLITGKSSISIKLSKLKVNLSGNKAQVSFVQAYKADTIDTVKPKTLWLAKAGGRWLIVKES